MDLFTTEESLFLAQVKPEPSSSDNGDQQWKIHHNNPKQLVNTEPPIEIVGLPLIKQEPVWPNQAQVKNEVQRVNPEYLETTDEQLRPKSPSRVSQLSDSREPKKRKKIPLTRRPKGKPAKEPQSSVR